MGDRPPALAVNTNDGGEARVIGSCSGRGRRSPAATAAQKKAALPPGSPSRSGQRALLPTAGLDYTIACPAPVGPL
jgi:hypothetical protein